MDNTQKITIRGARQHNLKNISLDIPRNKLVVITGLSGSGKSSLAFDTIFAEGQRRYIESLSAYARQFLEMMEKPDVDQIDGLSPAISIEQKTTSRNPRSTVGTVTEIYDYMRLLWARIGVAYSPATGLPIESQTIQQIVSSILQLPNKTRFYVLAPVVRGRKGEYKKDIQDYILRGFQRIKIDGTIYEIDDIPEIDKNYKHDISVVVDRLVLDDDIKERLTESVETAANLTNGIVIIEEADSGTEHMYSEHFSCPVSGFTISEIEPRIFSFNNPHGACPTCGGIGESHAINADLVIPDHNLSIHQGAVIAWGGANPSPWYRQAFENLCKHYGGSMTVPFKKLPEELKKAILYGTKEKIAFTFDDGLRQVNTKKTFEGVIHNLSRRHRETESSAMREEIEKFMSSAPCSSCNGFRLKEESLAIKIDRKNIGEITHLSIENAQKWFKSLHKVLNEKDAKIAKSVLHEINQRLGFLLDVGLSYLTLARAAGTLSGGESQCIRLASQIGSGLTGVLYVLDEPSIGLHQRDNERLLNTLIKLRDLGNTVLVVEHDEDAIKIADHLIDIGPRAGIHGGHVIAEGKPEEVFKHPDSLTAAYITGRKQIPMPAKRRIGNGQNIVLHGANGNNLKNVDLDIPLGTFTCVTGVSGSGKSTLVLETLRAALSRILMGSHAHPKEYRIITGIAGLDKIIDINQSPIGRTPRSNPATYTGVFTPIREWFAMLPESKAKGYTAGRFSFNVKGGRCESCQGDGLLKIEMHFLPNIYVTCDQCKGHRYNEETLRIKWREKNIFDILDMTVEAGVEFFNAVPQIREKLETLQKVGLGYIKIGQSATTLSGGEAQRIKLAKELSRKSTGRTIYILDEPTTGLHFEDINNLLKILHELVDKGNTVLVIEHNLEVIKTADWVVDIGPEGGDAGGQIVAKGTPEDVAKVKKSYTAQYLKQYFTSH